MTMPLPKRAVDLIGQVKSGFHPGLALDKHVEPPKDAERQKPILEHVCAGAADQALLGSLQERRRQSLGGAVTWTGNSRGPLTLHLSRATALENAGIALHPIYGFAYLPGSGLKGLARAWAERVWLEDQPDRNHAIGAIRAIFGHAPNSERDKSWIPKDIAQDPHSSVGAVVFHDAWPLRWPKLIVDVLAVHHSGYYQEPDERRVPPPGDWENPVPTTFLAVAPGAEFAFAVWPRRGQDPGLARQAAEWLKAALADWGAGAKTAAGYGRIISESAPRPIVSPQRRRFECTLELVTPAFLAGAFQREEDCDLRGATLRGQLRWWWRTMHAAHLEPRALRRLETAIWGAAGGGSAVHLALEPVTSEATEQIRMGGRDNPIGYLAYGMQRHPNRNWDRPAKPAGTKWRLTVTARAATFSDDPKSQQGIRQIEAQAVLDQAHAALWLLTHYGGVGAKGRKGFGSLADIPVDSLAVIDDCKKVAKALRDTVRLAGKPDFRAPCLEHMHPAEIALKPGHSLGDVADAYRAFVKSKSMRERTPLGLPRKESRVDMGLLDGPVSRHATTVHFHLARPGNGLVLRMAGFEIERIVWRAEFFTEMEGALRRSLGSGAPGTSPASRRPRTPDRSRGPQPARPEKARPFTAGGYALLEGMRVTIVEIRGNRARIRFPESGETEELDISELDPYRRG